MIERLIRRMRNALERGRLEREAAAEMRQHIELEVAELVRLGVDPTEARRTALRDFGSMDRWQEEARNARGWRWWDELRQDVRYGVRSLRGAPVFTAAAVLTLGLGIGANTAVFSVVNGVLLRPLGFEEPDRLVRMLDYRSEEIGTGRGTISYANFADMRARARLWENAAAYDEWRVSLTVDGVAERYDGAIVDAAWFDVLGAAPVLGRFFGPEDATPGGPARIVLSWGLWQQRFGGSPSVIGQTIDTNGYASEIIGVAPRQMEDPAFSGSSFDTPQLWRSPASYFTTNSRGSRSFAGLIRLAPGVTIEQAQQEANALQTQLVAEYPANNEDRVVRLVPLKETIIGNVRLELLVLLSAVGLVLLIACANVGNLLLVRATTRQREITLRCALGASRGRVVRQLLLESTLLAGIGALIGCAVAWAGTRALTIMMAEHLPRAAEVGADARVLAFTLVLTGVATLLFGLFPALHGARVEISGALRSGDRTAGSLGQTRLRAIGIGTQVALAVVVLVAAGLLTRSLMRLQAVDTGMDARAQVVSMSLTTSVYDTDELPAYYGRVLEDVMALPGVTEAGFIDLLPMSGSFNSGPFTIAGRAEVAPEDRPEAEQRAATRGYFEALRIPLVGGRLPDSRDHADAPVVVVVSRALAERYFSSAEAALGQRITTYDAERTIVGVVENVTQFTLDQAPVPTLYFPQAQAPEWMRANPILLARVERPAATMMPELRRTLQTIDARVPVADMRTMQNVVDETLVMPRFRTALLGLFAAIAFALAVIGIYGTLSYTVTRRQQEFGIRMALGATRPNVLMQVLRVGMRPVAAGAAAGVVLALAVSRMLEGMLYGVSPYDATTFLLVPIALMTVAVVAVAVPARRATRLEAVEALRND